MLPISQPISDFRFEFPDYYLNVVKNHQDRPHSGSGTRSITPRSKNVSIRSEFILRRNIGRNSWSPDRSKLKIFWKSKYVNRTLKISNFKNFKNSNENRNWYFKPIESQIRSGEMNSRLEVVLFLTVTRQNLNFLSFT